MTAPRPDPQTPFRPDATRARLYAQAASLTGFGAWECDLATEALTWTDAVYDLFELARGAPPSRPATLDFYRDESRRQMSLLRADAIRTGGGFTLDAQIRTHRGRDRWMRLTAQVARVDGTPVRIFGAKQDVTAERNAWARLRRSAERDPLTGLANRGVFEAQYRRLVTEGREDGSVAALALIDLDRFKAINDRHGHAAGDACLREVAMRLQRVFRDALLVARIGGDEFAVLLRAPLGRARIDATLQTALSSLARPVAWKDEVIGSGASIGVAIRERSHRRTGADLFADADAALYAAKAAGRNVARTFGDEARGSDTPAPVPDPSLRCA